MNEAAKEEEEDYEEMANRLIRESGKRRHNSDCATSCAPARKPGPCDCDAPADDVDAQV